MAYSASLRGAGVGRWFGEGRVYVMVYKRSNSYYKIGCTSRAPEERLEEIRDNEENQNIVLVGSVKALEMNSAETAGQRAVQRIGLVKDPSRGGATDWFIDQKRSRKPEEVFQVVRGAVYRANAQRNKKWQPAYQDNNIWM